MFIQQTLSLSLFFLLFPSSCCLPLSSMNCSFTLSSLPPIHSLLSLYFCSLWYVDALYSCSHDWTLLQKLVVKSVEQVMLCVRGAGAQECSAFQPCIHIQLTYHGYILWLALFFSYHLRFLAPMKQSL